MRLDPAVVERMYRKSGAERWSLPQQAFAEQLERSARRAFPEGSSAAAGGEGYFETLHLEDLALACACAHGIDSAWDHFVREFRPVLYRSADAIDPSGRAREIADSLYAELFGVDREQSLFRYFHGRSSLATWLRSVLSQRYVDAVRRERRLVPLPDDEDHSGAAAAVPPPGPAVVRYVEVLQLAVLAAVGALPARDRLRLRCYYADSLTLAQIGRMLGEHEATVSRHLARTRRAIRQEVEARLRDREGMTPAQIEEVFAAVLDDPGPLDVRQLLGSDREDDATPPRKKLEVDRSM